MPAAEEWGPAVPPLTHSGPENSNTAAPPSGSCSRPAPRPSAPHRKPLIPPSWAPTGQGTDKVAASPPGPTCVALTRGLQALARGQGDLGGPASTPVSATLQKLLFNLQSRPTPLPSPVPGEPVPRATLCWGWSLSPVARQPPGAPRQPPSCILPGLRVSTASAPVPRAAPSSGPSQSSQPQHPGSGALSPPRLLSAARAGVQGD